MTPIFYIQDGNLSFGSKNLLSDLELYIYPQDRICLVGNNGSGKSSLMKIIIAQYELDTGKLFQHPSATIGYLKQDMGSAPNETIYNFISSEIQDILCTDHATNNLAHYQYQIDIILTALEIDGNMNMQHCSGGQRRRVYLASALICKPDILLLDEPTNHLDIKAIEWLELFIMQYPGAVISISHDRMFQSRVTNKVWWIDRGTLRKSNAGFKYYDQWHEEILLSEEQKLRNLSKKLNAEKGWLNTGVTARRKRNQKRLAALYTLRISFSEQKTHLASAKQKLQISLSSTNNKNRFIIEAHDIAYSIDNKNLFSNFSLQVKKGEKIGVIGPNGAGKSTLIKILIKDLMPIEGHVTHGTNLEITYFDQHRTSLNPDISIKNTLCPNGGDQIFLDNKTLHVVGYLKQFLFDPKSLDDKVSTLSGGQMNRLLLAKSLIQPGNLLILDEPTNDLDMESLEVLLEMLTDYNGTLILVSHDRDFLERLVTRTLIFDDDRIIDLYGGYEDYTKYHKTQHKTQQKCTKKNTVKKSSNIISPSIGQSKSKLSYKYMRLLEILPGQIDQLEQQIISTEQALEVENLYNSNNKKFNLLTQNLARFNEELAEKLEQWVEIESKKEKLQ